MQLHSLLDKYTYTHAECLFKASVRFSHLYITQTPWFMFLPQSHFWFILHEKGLCLWLALCGRFTCRTWGPVFSFCFWADGWTQCNQGLILINRDQPLWHCVWFSVRYLQNSAFKGVVSAIKTTFLMFIWCYKLTRFTNSLKREREQAMEYIYLWQKQTSIYILVKWLHQS